MDDIQQIKLLAGISNIPIWHQNHGYSGSNISVPGTEKSKLMREHNIQPGTEAWFRLWFSKPYLTNEKPI